MKKLLSILIILIMAFAMLPSCQRARFDGEVNVAVLNGTTGFGIAPLYCDIQNGIHDECKTDMVAYRLDAK